MNSGEEITCFGRIFHKSKEERVLCIVSYGSKRYRIKIQMPAQKSKEMYIQVLLLISVENMLSNFIPFLG